jgi:hypothetical protein
MGLRAWLKCLLSKCKALSLNPSITKKKKGSNELKKINHLN